MKIETKLGPVEGIDGGNVQTFRGIPYAEPPVGDRRWRSAEPKAPWAHLDATQYANRCFQTPYHEVLSGFDLHGEESEDCLYLNIYTPDTEGTRPVMFWIHGGAYIQGSANEYDGAKLATENDVVVVAINYRLGIFGFLDLSSFGEAYAGTASLGISDQIAALEWVKTNIADYGGDPDCVTIFGESAGGGSVLGLLGAPAAQGLFHRAAALSPGEVMHPPQDNIERLAAHQDVAREALLEHLLTLPGEVLKDLQVRGVFAASIAVDGKVIVQGTVPALRSGAVNVPLIIGSCRDEGTLFTPIVAPEHHEFVAFAWAATAGNGNPKHYLAKRDELMPDADATTRVERAWTDMFRGSVVRVGQAATEGGVGGWVYNFAVPTNHAMGITHGSDVPFVFNELTEGGLLVHDADDERNVAVANLWSSALARFARTGDPNGGGLPSWPCYDAVSRSCLVIDHDPHVEDDPDGPEWRDAFGMS